MISVDSATRVIATSTYYVDDLYASDESFLQFIGRKLPDLKESEKKFFRHIDKKKLIFDAAFRTKTNIEYQVLVQRDYVLFSRYAVIKFFGNEKHTYCSLSAFSARETFPDFEQYINFFRGENPILDLGISSQSLVRWILKCLHNISLSDLERQIIGYEIKQLVDFFDLKVPEDNLLEILGLSKLDITDQSSYAQLLQDRGDFSFLIWKSYFRKKPNYFYEYGE